MDTERKFPWKWYLKDLPRPTRGKVFSTFACGGGSSMGYKRAGYEMVGCCEIDPEINEIYRANLHPKHNFLMDLRKFNELEDLPQDLYELDILDGSPPCFEAGTLVRVKGVGYKPIEKVAIGDMVLTHTGEFHEVRAVMSKDARVYCNVKIQGCETFKATPNHPFYVREMVRVGKEGKRFFGEPEFKAIGECVREKTAAGTTKRQYYVGLPINQESRLPAWEGVVCRRHIYGKAVIVERKQNLNFNNPALWRVIGRYLGDGWLRDDRKSTIICCAKDEQKDLAALIRMAGLNACCTEERTTFRFSIHSVELYSYLLQFGKGAKGKHLTDDVFDLPVDLQKEFLLGYLDADGHYEKDDGVWSCASISKPLLTGIAACVAKSYHQHFTCDNAHLWVPIRKVELVEAPLRVYNMSVEKDESYTVYNCAVHNCSTFSTAGKREKGWGVEKVFREGQAKQRLDDLFFVYLETVRKLKPKVCVAENVTGLVKGNAKGYVNEIVKQFRALGYEVQLFLLNGAYMEVPQKRERVFFVANRMGFLKLVMPKFDYKPVCFGEIKSPEGAKLKGNIGDVAGTARLLQKAKPGDTSLADINARERGKGNIGFTMNLVWDNMVPATVSSGGGVFRMPEGLECTTDDFRAMGTFPQDYWFGSDDVKDTKARRMAHYMVGMSVPPSMTAHIADRIWEQWLSKEAK